MGTGPNLNPVLFEAEVCGGSHDYHVEVRLAANGARYLRITDTRHAHQNEEVKRGVLVFEECGPDFWWALTRAISVLGDHEVMASAESVSGCESIYAEVRVRHPRAYEPWSESEDARLRLAYEQGMSVDAVARMLGRQVGAIESRLGKLGMK